MIISNSFKEMCGKKCDYEALRKRFDDGYKATIYHSTDCISPIEWMQIMPHRGAIKWLSWVNENICLQLDIDDFRTTDVKLRIATGMLNKIESMPDILKIQIHSSLTTNIKQEWSKIINEDLPF